jgi:hypothetical protein
VFVTVPMFNGADLNLISSPPSPNTCKTRSPSSFDQVFYIQAQIVGGEHLRGKSRCSICLANKEIPCRAAHRMRRSSHGINHDKSFLSLELNILRRPAVRPAAHCYPAPLAVRPQLPVAAFAGVRLTLVLARHRRVKTSVADVRGRRDFDRDAPASLPRCGAATTSM